MDETMGTGDYVIGALALIGVVILTGAVIWVLKTIILKKDDESDEQQ